MKHIIYIFLSSIFALINSQDVDPNIFREEFHRFMPDCNSNARKWIRSAFHEVGTFDRNSMTGGSDGSLRFELSFPENVGVDPIVNFCEDFVKRHNGVSFADTIMFGGKFAVETCDGPLINWEFGRIDASGPNSRGKLPNPGDSIQRSIEIFVNRMGFTKEEMVVLILGGHSVARINLVFGFNTKPGFTDSTPHLLDNLIFKEIIHNNMTDIIQIPADKNLLIDNDIKLIVNRFASNENLFKSKFKVAFEKMMNLGSKFKSTTTTTTSTVITTKINDILTTTTISSTIPTTTIPTSIFTTTGTTTDAITHTTDTTTDTIIETKGVKPTESVSESKQIYITKLNVLSLIYLVYFM